MFFKKKKKRLDELLIDMSVNYEKRAEAALAIAGLKDTKYFDVLAKSLLHDPEPSVRMNSAYALGELSMKAAKEPLLESLTSDGSEWVRGFSASALANLNIDFADIEPILINMLEKDTDAGARRHYAHTLGKIGTEKSGEILISMLRNDLDPGVRADCAEALGELSLESAYDVIVNAAKNDISGDVRRQAFVAQKKIEESRITSV